jgi:hypothetical protein
MHPPDPEMGRAAPARTAPNSHRENHAADLKPDILDFQALRLKRLYFLAHDIARTIAALAYGVAR